MRKGRKRRRMGKKITAYITSLPVDRLTATDCNATARAKTSFTKVVKFGVLFEIESGS